MTKPFIRVAVAVAMLAACLAAAAAPRAVTLAQVFPELADLPETGEVGIGIGWMGLSPLSPVNASYILERHGEQFEGLGFFQFADKPAVKRAVTIPRDLVRALLTAANKVEVVEGQYRPRIEHTDDYPSLDIEVVVDRQKLHIGSRSQQRRPPSGDYVDRTPWQVDYRGRTFVVTASDLDQAFEPLEPHLQDRKAFDEMWDDDTRKR